MYGKCYDAASQKITAFAAMYLNHATPSEVKTMLKKLEDSEGTLECSHAKQFWADCTDAYNHCEISQRPLVKKKLKQILNRLLFLTNNS